MAGKSISIRTRARRRQEGFTLIETLISMVVMTVGLVALLGVFGLAMASTQTSQENAIGKRLANEALEGILTARETANITWGELQNTGSGGIFLAGAQPINNPGVDGIIGTADDAAAGTNRFQSLSENWWLLLRISWGLLSGERRRRVGYAGVATFNGIPGVPSASANSFF